VIIVKHQVSNFLAISRREQFWWWCLLFTRPMCLVRFEQC